MNMLEIKQCPHGRMDGKCTHRCIFQDGKWKDEEIPTIEIEKQDDGKLIVICTDAEED